MDKQQTVTTPAAVELSRATDHEIVVSKEGYQSETVAITRDRQGFKSWAAGGIIGVAVDSSNGSVNELEPARVNVTLRKSPTTSPTVDPLTTELLRLRKLHDDKLISDDEYTTLKAKSLARTAR